MNIDKYLPTNCTEEERRLFEEALSAEINPPSLSCCTPYYNSSICEHGPGCAIDSAFADQEPPFDGCECGACKADETSQSAEEIQKLLHPDSTSHNQD